MGKDVTIGGSAPKSADGLSSFQDFRDSTNHGSQIGQNWGTVINTFKELGLEGPRKGESASMPNFNNLWKFRLQRWCTNLL